MAKVQVRDSYQKSTGSRFNVKSYRKQALRCLCDCFDSRKIIVTSPVSTVYVWCRVDNLCQACTCACIPSFVQ